jgi:O-antigen/teichoic acid export membrane protein
LMAFLVVAVSAHWAARSIVNRPEMTSLIIVCAAAFIPQALVGTSRSVFTVLGRFRLTALVETLMTILRILLVLGLVMSGWQVTGVVWGNAVAMIATGLVYGVAAWMLMLRAWGGSLFQGNWQSLKGRWREILGFLAYSDLNALLGLIAKQLDVLMLGYFRNPTEVGYYKLAKNLASGLSHLAGPLRSVTYPQLAHLWSAGRLSDFRRVLHKLAVTLAIPLIFAVMASVLSAPLAIHYFLGESYLEASFPTQLLLIATGLRLVGFWVGPFYLATGQVRLLTLFALAGAIGAVPLYVVCIWFWGASGLAVARVALTLLTDTAAAVMVFWGIRSNYGPLSTKPMGSPVGN